MKTTAPSCRRRQRRLRIENLENRLLLNVDWRNPVDSLDVNSDGFLSAIDALTVINDLNLVGSRPLSGTPGPGDDYIDSSGDGVISPIDALLVINRLNERGAGIRSLREGQFLADEDSITVTVGGEGGLRVVSLDVQATFSKNPTSGTTPDLFALYVVDPEQPATTLLDRGQPGTAVFSLTAGKAEFVPGLVRWDGQLLQLDLSSLTTRDTARLTLQLLNGDPAGTAQVTIRPLANQVDPKASSGPVMLPVHAAVAPAAALNLANLLPRHDIEAALDNIRFDSQSGLFEAELRVRSGEQPLGRSTAILFPDLPAGVTVVNASGATDQGVAYINLAEAIGQNGLGRGIFSERVRVALLVNDNRLFPFAPQVHSRSNQGPTFADPGLLSVMPGDVLTVELAASDPDGDPVSFSLAATNPLPAGRLSTRGTLTFQPTEADLGSHTFTLIASDGLLETRREVTLEVVPDPSSTTRISGFVLDVDGTPLGGLRVEVGAIQGLTQADGSFLLDLGTNPHISDTLKIRGETYSDPARPEAVYPFIAERLPLTLGRPVLTGLNNRIERPIYLPQLDLGNGQQVDPSQNLVVTTEAIAGVSVHIAAGTLLTQQGIPFTGVLSVTEVPIDLTPISLPSGMNADIVVTIQPGEMVFATPAPLSFPNRGGSAPGTIMDLWSINPTTGDFEDVGDMRVSDDGQLIETISGGIRNSSWHFPLTPPEPFLFDDLFADPFNFDPACPEQCIAQAPLTSAVELHSGALMEHHDTVTYESLGQSRGLRLVYDSLRADPRPIVNFGFNSQRSVLLAASLVYQLGDLQLRAPGFLNTQGIGFPSHTVRYDGNSIVETIGKPILFNEGEHIWQTNLGVNRAALQVDLRTASTNLIPYDLSFRVGTPALVNRFGFTSNGAFLTMTSGSRTTSGQFLHVNGLDSPLGAGWGLAGIQQLHEGPDGAVMLVDGDGSEMLFTPPGVPGEPYVSPAEDFSRLEKLEDGTFRRTLLDRTVYRFDNQRRLVSITDRNGNVTVNAYDDAGRLLSQTDPVGLVTRLDYDPLSGSLRSITDPIGRATRLVHDESGNLMQIIDPDGATRTFEYDSRNLMVAEVDPRQLRETAEYDFSGRLVGATTKDGTTISIAPVQTRYLLPVDQTVPYRAMEIVREIPVPGSFPDVVRETLEGVVTGPRARTFAESPAVANYAMPGGAVVTSQLDSAGRVVNQRDATGTLISHQRGPSGLVERSVNPLGLESFYTYDERGNLLAVRDLLPILVETPDDGDGFRFTGEQFASTDFAWGNWHEYASSGDLDGDGLVDLVLTGGGAYDHATNHLARGVLIVRGRPGGGFSDPEWIPHEGGRYSSLADVTADGHLDIVTMGGTSIEVFVNDGQGNFASPRVTVTEVFLDNGGHSRFAFADFTGDGKLDMLTSTFHAPGLPWVLVVLPGDGEGGFLEAVKTVDAVQHPRGNHIPFDVDGDGHLDVVQRAPNNSIVLRLGDGSGAFPTAHTLSARGNPLAVADINRDGHVDLITHLGDPSLSSNHVSVFFGTGGLEYSLPVNTIISVAPNFFRSVDYDGDGLLDLIVVGRDARNANSMALLRGTATGFEAPVEFPTSDQNVYALEVLDASGDGVADLVAIAGWNGLEINTFRGYGAGQFDFYPPIHQVFNEGANIEQIRLAHLNADSIPDVVALFADKISIQLGDGIGGFSEPQIHELPDSGWQLAVADLTGDGFDDVATIVDGSVWILPSDGLGARGEAFSVRLEEFEFQSFALTDVNQDGRIDIVGGANSTMKRLAICPRSPCC